MSKDLNVSITPVREAFARLSNQGLLTVFPYKGTYVTIISREYIEDVYYLRENLEKMAAEKAWGHINEEDIQFYEDLLVQSDQYYEQGDLYESIRCDMAFHEKLIELSGSSLLAEMWSTIKYRIENIQSYTKTAMNMRMSKRHAPMMDALRNRDMEQYLEALKAHLGSSNNIVPFPLESTIIYE